jgi:hypothetical protein
MLLRVILVTLAALLLAAHFFREGSFLLVAVCVAAPLLFLWKKRWSLVLLQLAAYAAAVTWIVVAMRLVEVRQQMGRSWTAAVLILGAVALFTLAAGALLNSRAIRERYSN